MLLWEYILLMTTKRTCKIRMHDVTVGIYFTYDYQENMKEEPRICKQASNDDISTY